MALAFWLDKWRENDIPFHKPIVQEDLEHYWPALALKPGAKVLVPLSGKSLDMIWLLQQGMIVYGIDISELAIEAFIAEHQLNLKKEVKANHISYANDKITLIAGDYFQLNKESLPCFDAVYDRGALVALPEKLRPAYLNLYLSCLKPEGRVFLKTVYYEDEGIEGPPYAIRDKAVYEYYASCRQITCLMRRLRYLDARDSLYKRGLKTQTDTAWVIKK